VTRLLEPAEAGTDLDVRVLEAYFNQSQAEAQEVTIARAIELKHSPSLIAGLCYETSKLFKLSGVSHLYIISIYYIILCYIILYYVILYYIILCYIILCYIILCYN